jgi:hypothetical protein
METSCSLCKLQDPACYAKYSITTWNSAAFWPLVDTRHNANLEPGQEISLGIMERQCPEKKMELLKQCVHVHHSWSITVYILQTNKQSVLFIGMNHCKPYYLNTHSVLIYITPVSSNLNCTTSNKKGRREYTFSVKYARVMCIFIL